MKPSIAIWTLSGLFVVLVICMGVAFHQNREFEESCVKKGGIVLTTKYDLYCVKKGVLLS